MPITVKHLKVSTVPDAGDDTLVEPSDWNADHTLTGLGTMAEQNANAVAITGGTISGVTIPASNITGTLGVPNGGTGATTLTGYVKGTGTTPMTASATIPNTDITGLGTASTKDAGSPNGVATLDAGGKVPVSELPAAVLGALSYQGTWDASTNTPILTSSVGTKGYYYVVSVAGNTNLNGITDWLVGDWAVYNGTVWQKVDNTDAGGDVVGPSSATDNALARFDTTTGKLIQNSVVTVSDTGAIAGATTITDIDYIDFDTTYATTLGAGQLGWNGNDTLGLGMIGGNVVQHIGEDTFFYVKASATITKGQLCMFTGAVGSSGVLTAAPSTAIPFAEAIIGVAAENIANNGFGLVQSVGTLRGVDTSAFLDGDILYYNSAVTGGFTKTYPASGPVVIAAAVAKSGSGGSGVLTVRISFQTRVTGSTGISVVQGNDTVALTNTGVTSAVAGTGISVSGATGAVTVTNTAPDQVVSLTGAGTTSISGTYPNFTVTSNDQFTGTVTSVTGTSPVVSSGGNTPAISLASGYGDTQNPYASKTANFVLAAPNGSAGVPTFRAVVAADIPTLNQNTTGTASNVTGIVALANGGTGSTSATQAYTALRGWTTTVTASGTTTLTNTSTYQQEFTGSATQTVVLPDVTTLALGWAFELINNSSGNLAIQSSGTNSIGTALAGTTARLICRLTTGTTAASWDFDTTGFANITGSGSAVLSTNPSINGITATGALSLNGSTISNSTLGTSQTSGTLTIGGASQTGTFIVGRSTVSQQTDIQAGATASGSTKTMNIGTGGLAGSTTNIAIGSTTGTSTTTINGTLNTPVINATNGIVVNNNTVSANYTIPSGSSASSVGPMTVSSGIVVTVSSGSRWVVL
jgi:hypothetical protein